MKVKMMAAKKVKEIFGWSKNKLIDQTKACFIRCEKNEGDFNKAGRTYVVEDIEDFINRKLKGLQPRKKTRISTW